MMKREKVVYSLFLMVTVALASTVAFLYINYQDSRRSVEQESYQTLSRRADMISDDIEDIISRLYAANSEMHADEYRLSQGGISNETREELQWRTLDTYFPDLFYQRADDFESKMGLLCYLSGESSTMYTNISDTFRYTIVQILFAWYSRTPNDAYRLMVELGDITGAYPVGGGGHGTPMEGIGHSFRSMSAYWNALSYPNTYPTPTTQPSVMLEWAVGNATQMYQALVVWHENNPR